MNTQTKTCERINVTLPKNTLQLVNKTVEKGSRSRFIDKAIRYYVKETKRADIKRRLREGSIENSKRDILLANEWFALENEI